MMKSPREQRIPELLAPAGSLDAFLAALAAGADAVYTGVGAFNARASAPDMSFDELALAARIAHARGARVYVTLNVYVDDQEVEQVVDVAKHALAAGADALIVADAGLVLALRESIPQVEIHLSTQAGVHAAPGMRFAAERLGAKRVTCGREVSVAEIAALAATGVEVEAFCHGAICICYAGACAFSALRRGRSANRGDCTQPCRQHYDLVDGEGRLVAGRGELLRDASSRGAGRGMVPPGAAEGDMLLCPRDYLSVRHLRELVDAGVGALKIEGRMKNPDYVYNVVRTYRSALDAIARGHEVDAAALEAQLARSFNRGFSVEYLDGRSGAALMSWERSCNQGLWVGTVVGRRHEEVVIAFEHAVDAGDTLEIRSSPAPDAPADVPKRWPMIPCPADAAAGDRRVLRCKRKVEVGSAVHVVRSAGVLAQAEGALAAMRAECELAEGADRATAADSSVAEGLPRDRSSVDVDALTGEASVAGGRGLRIQVVASTPDQVRALLADRRVDEVAVHAEALLEDDAASWDPLLGDVRVLLGEVCRDADLPRVRELCRRAASVSCGNLSQVQLALDGGAAFDVEDPVLAANARAACGFAALGARRAWLPVEHNAARLAQTASSVAGRVPLGATVFGLPRLMVCEHCVLTAEGPCSGCCPTCERRLGERFLVTSDGGRLPVATDALGRSRIYDGAPRDLLDDVPVLLAAGIRSFRIDALGLGPAVVEQAVARLHGMRAPGDAAAW